MTTDAFRAKQQSLTERVRAEIETRERIEGSARSFDLFDAKGRELGYWVAIDRRRFVTAADDAHFPYVVPATWVNVDTYVVEPHALKDGKWFGAIPVNSRRICFSLEEARAAAEELFANARKRATKAAVAL